MTTNKSNLAKQMAAATKRKPKPAPLSPIEKQVKRYELYIAHARRQLSTLNSQHDAKVGEINKRISDYQEIVRKLKA